MSNIENAVRLERGNPVIPMVILTLLFFILGFVTWLNGPLIPFFELACELSSSQAYFVTFAFYIAYFVMAIPSSWIIEKVGYKNGISLGLLIIAAGAFMFYPAASSRTFLLFLIALFVMGTGLAVLQTASNPYVVVIGPRESAAARISVLGIANKLAGFVAPIVLTALVLSNMQDFTADKIALLDEASKTAALNSLALQLQRPYLYMGLIIMVLALLVKFSPLPEIDLDEDGNVTNLSIFQQIKNAFKYPQLVLGVVTLMLYISAEVLAGDSIGGFGKQLGVYGDEGNFYLKLTSFTMSFMVVGYVLGITLIPKYLSQVTALKASGFLGLILVLAIVLISPKLMIQLPGIPNLPIVILLVALLGLANALCWPAIWPMALQDLGGYTKIASAILIMGIIGGAVFPLFYGMIVEHVNTSNIENGVALTSKSGNQIAYLILLPSYLMILFYAIKGHKYRSWKI
ncbi:sugar MFS transporter [Flavobacterium sp. FlaQc-52]|jgi:FHS family L-fucose permease-like MFS transporter|uniref:Sugar MFS transporter n=1 Tax=Flavobacterium cupriresistens TaxID=2893885 RepID=A0ABU4R6X7_9FLAO|nr:MULTISPECIES: sugar MFS transporter [unclassified Flavobacterium]MDX6188339.1 sugar MFS transporter [Flavobacterium sp. Fl-318]UFH40620.1 sugar MFS transporter [Flavobacterium sp. F-323]